MLFNPEPKTKVEDFFNMEEELRQFRESLNVGKLIIVSGLRRYGKTSLILTGLNSFGLDYVFLDCRLLPSGMFSINDFLSLLEDELNRKSWAKEVLRGINGLSVSGLSLRFRRRDQNILLNALKNLEGKVIVLDEAQELRRSNYRFDYLLAHLYDHVNVKIIVSGSQVGLLYKFLRVDNPEAPLFGRPYLEIKLKRLSAQKSKTFLERGFEEEGLKVPSEVIEEAVKRFDGNIGWLTYFGYSYTRGNETIERIFEKASKLSVNEVKHALNVYGLGRRRYVEVLKIVASGTSLKWSEIKRGIEAKLGKIPNNTLSNIIHNLVNQGFLEKTGGEYTIPDPILRNGIIKYL